MSREKKEDEPEPELERNRVVFVKAHFRERWVEKKVWVKCESENSHFTFLSVFRIPRFKREIRDFKVATSDCEIDGEKLAEDIRAATLALNEQGYEVTSLTPVSSGQYSPRYDKSSRSRVMWRNAMKQIGYGFSYTEGFIVVAGRI